MLSLLVITMDDWMDGLFQRQHQSNPINYHYLTLGNPIGRTDSVIRHQSILLLSVLLLSVLLLSALLLSVLFLSVLLLSVLLSLVCLKWFLLTFPLSIQEC